MVRIVAATFHPACENSVAAALPIPLFDPVISTVFAAMTDLPLMCLRKESLELFEPTAIFAYVSTLEHSLWLTNSYPQATTSMLINELAKRAGVSVHTIRFYERYGLVRGHRDPTITSNNYLHYDEESVDRLELILDAKSAGFTLQEISEIIDAWYKDTYTKR
ncbi:MAG: MerR family transcriptional regulator, partial [Candidatus Kapabacteria bacterium]|nr:MerR family transcriptional regulator [Candidatus Kapabacteria bacterium]